MSPYAEVARTAAPYMDNPEASSTLASATKAFYNA